MPRSRHSVASTDIETSTIDDLFERYLHLLDQYTTLREDLSRELSSGFLSLTQANFTSMNRTRYGQDLYDARMQATLTVEINRTADKFIPISTFPPDRSAEKAGRSQAGHHAAIVDVDPQQDDTGTTPATNNGMTAATELRHIDGGANPPTTAEISFSPVNGASDCSSNPRELALGYPEEDTPPRKLLLKNQPSSLVEKQSKEPQDPLRQFGILVPPGLRAAQSAFARAARQQVPGLVETIAEMASLERVIREAKMKRDRGDEQIVAEQDTASPGAEARTLGVEKLRSTMEGLKV